MAVFVLVVLIFPIVSNRIGVQQNLVKMATIIKKRDKVGIILFRLGNLFKMPVHLPMPKGYARGRDTEI